MTESTLTSKGQTTIPLEVRSALGAKPGTRLVWHVLSDGSIRVRVKSKSVLELAGMLKAPRRKRIKIEQMNAWR